MIDYTNMHNTKCAIIADLESIGYEVSEMAEEYIYRHLLDFAYHVEE